MRALLFLLPVLLASCRTVVSQHEIIVQSRAELMRREPWADNAVILVQQSPKDWRLTWKVSAGYFDHSESPSAQGIRVIPGTERELRFTRDGCLIGYDNPTSRCVRREADLTAPATWSAPADK